MIGLFAARAGMAWSARAAATAAVSSERQREPTRLAMSILHRHKWSDPLSVVATVAAGFGAVKPEAGFGVTIHVCCGNAATRQTPSVGMIAFSRGIGG